MKLSNIKQKNVSDIRLNDVVDTIDREQELYDIMSGKLDHIDLDNMTEMSMFSLSQSLKEIIRVFGGKLTEMSVDITLTADDFAKNRQVLFFTPILAANVDEELSIDWGDSTTSTYSVGDIPWHEYAEPGAYHIVFNTRKLDQISVKTVNSEVHSFDNNFNNSTSFNMDAMQTTFYSRTAAGIEAKTIDADVISEADVPAGTFAVTFGANVVEIAADAFKDCSTLQFVFFAAYNTLTDAELKIKENAFANCVNLVGNIDIPDNCVLIADNAFANCVNVHSFAVPASCKTIGTGAFFNCISMLFITYKNRKPAEINEFIQASLIENDLGETLSKWFIKNGYEPASSEYIEFITAEKDAFDETLDEETAKDKYKADMLFKKEVLRRVADESCASRNMYFVYLYNYLPSYVKVAHYKLLNSSVLNFSKLYYSQLNDDAVFASARESMDIFGRQGDPGYDPYNPCEKNTCSGKSQKLCTVDNTCKIKNICTEGARNKCEDNFADNSCNKENACTKGGINKCEDYDADNSCQTSNNCNGGSINRCFGSGADNSCHSVNACDHLENSNSCNNVADNSCSGSLSSCKSCAFAQGANTCSDNSKNSCSGIFSLDACIDDGANIDKGNTTADKNKDGISSTPVEDASNNNGGTVIC